jgi:hypothetical protein
MATCVQSLSFDRSHPHTCSTACVPVSGLYHRMRNALQSLSNCAYLLARDPGVSGDNAPLLTQMQSDVALVSVLFRGLEPRQSDFTTTKEEL